MERLAYILDTNVISDNINGIEPTMTRTQRSFRSDTLMYFCQPVAYEVLRGLMRTKAVNKMRVYEKFVPQLTWVELIVEDWRQAAQLWADATSRGKQLSDVDLLLAALCIRLNAILVSSDADFDALPIQRENWRDPS
jgi:predicted nucleic acid-binding protein